MRLFSVALPEPHIIQAPESREGRGVVHNGIKERFPFLTTQGEGELVVCRPDLKGPLVFRDLLTFPDLQRLQLYLSRSVAIYHIPSCTESSIPSHS
jgi:hypothetical protein